jgi:methionine--tRNA ligase beta chain
MADIVSFEEFKKLEIKIGKVLSAEKIPEGDKLLKIMFDIGTGTPRQIMAGIAAFFPDPSVLVGKEMPLIINLAPRILRGYVSEGMLLAAGGLEKAVLLHPAEEVLPGAEVR